MCAALVGRGSAARLSTGRRSSATAGNRCGGGCRCCHVSSMHELGGTDRCRPRRPRPGHRGLRRRPSRQPAADAVRTGRARPVGHRHPRGTYRADRARGDRTGREAEDLAAALQLPAAAGRGRAVPGAGRRCRTSGSRPRADTVGRRLAVLRRLRPPGRRATQRPAGCASSSRRSAPCCSRRCPASATWSRSARGRRRRSTLDELVQRAGRGRLRPGRPGREARRVRRPRRHPRRLPADRGAPAAGGVLGRRGRGDPLLRGRRPALAGDRRARPVGAAVPGAAAHRRGAGPGGGAARPSTPSWPRCSTSSPTASPSRAWRRSRRCWSTSCELAARRAAGRHARAASATRSGSAPAPHDLVRTSEEFLEASWAAAAGGGKAPIDLGAAALPRAGRGPRRDARELGLPWWTLVAVRRRRRLGDEAGTDSPRWRRRRLVRGRSTYRGDTDAAARPTWAGWARDGWRVALVFEGHGPAERAVERAARGRGRRARLVPSCSTRAGARRGHRHHRPARAAASLGRAQAGGAHRDRPGRAARRVHQGHAPDAVPAAQRRRPAAAEAAATTWCTSSTASAATSRWCSAPSTAASASTWSSSTRRKRGQPGDRLFVPTDRSTRSPATSAARRRRCTGSAARDWAKAKGRARKAVKEIAARADPALLRPDGPAGPRLRRRTRRGSASWRTPSPTSRRPTSSPPSTRSRPTWRSRSRWTG